MARATTNKRMCGREKERKKEKVKAVSGRSIRVPKQSPNEWFLMFGGSGVGPPGF